jgi:peptide/nickel transport system permease protein
MIMKGYLRFLANRQNAFALAIVGIFILVASAAPLIAPPTGRNSDPAFTITGRPSDRAPHPPSKAAPLGTLPGQINIFYTLVWGARTALRFGLIVTLSTALFGVMFGALSGLSGSLLSRLAIGITDAFLATPVIAGIVLFKQLQLIVLENAGLGGWLFFGVEIFDDPELLSQLHPLTAFFARLDPVMLALILFSWMPYTRIMHAVVLDVRQAEFMDAARALGASNARLILCHLIPNTISPAIVLAARDIGALVLFQATFTFIGLGGGSEWGQLLVLGRNFIIGPGGNLFRYWWVFMPATLVLVLFGIGWNLLGDGLNEWLNPRERQGLNLLE